MSYLKSSIIFWCFYQIHESRKRIKRKINHKALSLKLWGHKRGCNQLSWKFKQMAKGWKESLVMGSIWIENHWGWVSNNLHMTSRKNLKSKFVDEAKLAKRLCQAWNDNGNYDVCKLQNYLHEVMWTHSAEAGGRLEAGFTHFLT